jgi:hypothetical protein
MTPSDESWTEPSSDGPDLQPKPSESNGAQPEELKHEIDQVRSQLDVLIRELDRRRHEATDVVLQVRKHPLAATVVGAAAALVTAALAVSVYRALRPEPPINRALQLAHALSIAGREPEKLLRALGE